MPENKLKLSPTMRETLLIMADGWEMGQDHDRIWMQKGGLGRGGQTLKVYQTTWWGLYQRGLIYNTQQRVAGWVYVWRLTEAGQAVVDGILKSA